MNQGLKRRLEIDLLRTLAIAAMVLYHLLYDLEVFYGWNIQLFSPGWKLFEVVTASLFLLLSGISFTLSWQRSISTHPTPLPRYAKHVQRGLKVLIFGVIISLVTFLFDPETYVRFGILHLIGVGTFLLPLFTLLGTWSLIPGLMIIALGLTLPTTGSSSLLLPLGVMPPQFSSVDYFPLVPWFGVILIGYAIGIVLYVQSRCDPRIPYQDTKLVRVLAWPGRYSLLIYLVHQPLLLAILWVLLGVPRT